MLIDTPQIVEGSSIVNATVSSGSSFPTTPNVGELFYLTSAGITGIYLYTGSDWNIIAFGGADEGDQAIAELNSAFNTHVSNYNNHITAFNAHVADDDRHLTTAQNTFLDGVTVQFSDVNKLAGLELFLGPTTTVAQYINTLNNAKLARNGAAAMTGNLNMGGFRFINVAAPTLAGDVATKAYVDSIVSDEWVKAMVARSVY